MRVIHIIPSAFNYFDDIRAASFSLMENLDKIGVAGEAFTVQFTTAASKSVRSSVAIVAPSKKYLGVLPVSEAINSFKDFDIIHVHCPLFGAASKILRWMNDHPEQPLIITYYRRVRTPDFFSFFIVGYNLFFLPKLAAAADAFVSSDISKVSKRLANKARRFFEVNDGVKFGDTDLTHDEEGRELSADERLAIKYAMVYNKAVSAN